MMKIRDGGLEDSRVQALLAHHFTTAHAVSPPGSAHALDLSGLRQSDVSFWSGWDGERVIAIGALKATRSEGEIKSMHTEQSQRRKGAGSMMLRHIIAQARQMGLFRLNLETGSLRYFDPARELYKRHGFVECPPFGSYVPDANNVFMTLAPRANATCMEDLLDMSVKLFLLYVLAWSLAALSPGQAVMCSMAQSTRYGFRSSLVGVAGIQLGSSLLFISIALGLGTLLANATVAFRVLQAFGAIYLFYLGARLIGSSFQDQSVRESQSTASVAHQSLFVQGLVIQLTNPKALLFISALLPQFVESHRSVPLQILSLLVATLLIDTVVLSSYAYFAQRGIRSFRASRFYAWVERVLGAALVFFGLRLLVAHK